MTRKQATLTNLLLSLVFALAIIGSAVLVEDKGVSRTVSFLLIAVWFVPFFYLSRKMRER